MSNTSAETGMWTSEIRTGPASAPNRPRVYLAGPISGLDYQEAQLWRGSVKRELSGQIDCYSPLRAKRFLDGRGKLDGAYDEHPLSTQKGITTRDRNDTQRADLVLVNLRGAKKVSIGTMMELGWADSRRIPIVVIMEPSGNPHDHPMVREVAMAVVPTTDEAIEVVRAILLPD